MEAFIALRAKARDKRDKAINHARAEYEATLVQIATLEQDLLGKHSSRHRTISSCIESLIPADRTFTTQDIFAGLKALDPGRTWRKRAIDNHFFRLRERGQIKRIKRANAREPAIYVREGVEAKGPATGDMTLTEAINLVLTKPMTATELLVAVVEVGYESAMSKHNLRSHIASLVLTSL